ncbi:e3 ubiquitin-protein ligase NRDP1 [Trichonephila clavata]|uniref:E3 ubiquitin-protein ligase NRDP1 n=1 Tax=Trichonephila clavata TaxID=2740835 RepID=A0A8X6HIW9_TRICU|nr:e3 ubiquitin-protein ligase NRDP1 [Trichonephila clavata]
MGYDIARFQGEVDEELICPICSSVLEEPLHAPQCEHAFCKSCINEWLSRQPSCPVDRQPLTPNDLKPVPQVHKEECEHNPKRPVPCEQGCGLVIPKDELRVCMFINVAPAKHKNYW